MKQLLLLFLGLSLISRAGASEPPAKKYLDITVTANGAIYMWPDTLIIDELSENVEQRLWKSYLGTGKMYDEIRITYETGTSGQLHADALKSIKEGQTKALTQVCLQKNRKTYDELTSRQQKKIRRQFPVLFQELN
jgi:hypothetical protein